MRFKATIRNLLAIALAIAMLAGVGVAQDVEPQRFDIVLTLDAKKVQQLRQSGYLKASLPRQFYNRVDSVILKSPDSFKNDLFAMTGNIDRRNKTLMVNVDNSVLNHLDWQPVKMKVYESNFTAVLLAFDADRGMIEHLPSTVDQDKDSPLIFLRTIDGKGLKGHVEDRESLKFTTDFGEIDFPFQSFAGMRFNVASGEQGSRSVIVFENGDLVSGNIRADPIILKTIWGDKEFSLEDLKSITKTRDVELINPYTNEPNRWIFRSLSNSTTFKPEQ